MGKWISFLDYFGSSTTITRYSSSKQPNAPVDDSARRSSPLQFTGNWFIDAGILGFVNLMEEVYGWDLEELWGRIEKNPEYVYYWYFPIGYICHVVREVQTKEGPEKRKEIEDIIKEIPEPSQFVDEKNLFEKAWEWIIGNELLIGEIRRGNSKIKRLKLSWSGRYRLLTNFPLFQPGYDIERQKNIFMSILGLKEFEDEVLIYIDKTTSKFLPSSSDFPNISFTNSSVTMETLVSLNPKASMFILTYPLGFASETLNFLKHQIMFYTPQLGFTYNVNRKLKVYLKKVKEENNRMDKLFKVTWKSIIDSISELESIWALENMYIIKIKPPTGQKQDLENVEYIGIPKLQASILLEDFIRESLNVNIRINDNWVWILEEFIKNRSLHPLILKYVQNSINENNPLTRNIRMTSLYALAVDAKIKENNSIDLFSDEFFTKYRDIVSDIKETYRELSIQANSISKLFDSREERQNLCYSLMAALKRRNRIAFTNILLKKFLENTEKKEISYLTNFVFNRITTNDISWENHALALVVGAWSYGGEKVGESVAEE